MDRQQKRLLIVDDDKIHRLIYASVAKSLHCRVDLADSATAAFSALSSAVYDGMILDLVLGEESGRDVLLMMSSLHERPNVLLVTGADDKAIEETFATGRQMGLKMFGPVRKPVNVGLIRSALRDMEIGGTESEPRASADA